MKITSVETLYTSNLKHLYSVEKQLTAALEKLAGAASNEQLKQAFQDHLEETKEQLERIEQLLTNLGQSPGRKKAKGLEAIVAEGEEIINAEGDETAKDLGLIDAAQRTEHHEMSIYGCTAEYAKQLGREEDAQTLHTTLEEEKKADKKLTRIAKALASGEEVSAEELESEDSSDEEGQYAVAGGMGGAQQRTDQQGAVASAARNTGGFNHNSERSSSMARRDEYDYDNGRSYGGSRSSQMQERDEYGQFAGYGGGGRGGRSRYDEDDDDRGSSSRGGGRSSSRYGGGDITDSAGRHYSRDSWERAQEGRSLGGQHSHGGFGGGGGGGRSRYDEDDDRGYSSRGGGRGRSSRYDDEGDITDSAGRHYSRESWERAQEGRSLGGQHSHGGYGGGGGRYR